MQCDKIICLDEFFFEKLWIFFKTRGIIIAHGITHHAGKLVEGIINRKGTGPCPFEEAVMEIQDAPTALIAIREKMRQMQ